MSHYTFTSNAFLLIKWMSFSWIFAAKIKQTITLKRFVLLAWENGIHTVKYKANYNIIIIKHLHMCILSCRNTKKFPKRTWKILLHKLIITKCSKFFILKVFFLFLKVACIHSLNAIHSVPISQISDIKQNVFINLITFGLKLIAFFLWCVCAFVYHTYLE